MRLSEGLVTAAGLATVLAMGTAQGVLAQEKIKPFVLASSTDAPVEAAAAKTRDALTAAGFSVAGEYSPYDGAHVIVVTSDALKQAAAASERGGYLAAQRVSVTRVGDRTQVAYANPHYIENAYRSEQSLAPVAEALAKALGAEQHFGSEEGLTGKELRDYHYTFLMEYFEDPYRLAKYDDHQAAVAAVEKHLADNDAGVSKVYRIDIPGKDAVLFGVSMKSTDEHRKYMDDAFQMQVVDFGALRGTAYLPYEILVNGREVEALHMRFRMAVHFPDLSMMGEHSFMTLNPSPDAVHEALAKATGGSFRKE